MAEWNGRPQNPERHRCHLVVHPADEMSPDPEVALYWNGTHWVTPGDARRYEPHEMVQYRYLGPCLTPTEVAAEVQAEREACATLAEDHQTRGRYRVDFTHDAYISSLQIAAAIRARGPTLALTQEELAAAKED